MKIDIIGRGNVGTHLAKALKDKADVRSVASRTLEGLRGDADLYLICVSDSAISTVGKRLKTLMNKNGVLAHTSGSTPLSEIAGFGKRTGVFYPLQTFSKDVSLDYAAIHFFIEGNDKATEKMLADVARMVGSNVHTADSEQRRALHVASVLSCNFVNHLWELADRYLKDQGLDFSYMLPLIRETAAKVERVSPAAGQTGPAVRHDRKILESHLRLLEYAPELQDIYSLLSMSIMSLHPSKGNN